MIGLDSNVLVRYLAQDDPAQSPRATAIMEKRLTEANPGFISVVAMVEMAWVLERVYDLRREEIAAAIERLLQAHSLVIEDEQEVYTALAGLREGLGSFADAVIAALCGKAGCSSTLTFANAALRIPGFLPA